MHYKRFMQNAAVVSATCLVVACCCMYFWYVRARANVITAENQLFMVLNELIGEEGALLPANTRAADGEVLSSWRLTCLSRAGLLRGGRVDLTLKWDAPVNRELLKWSPPWYCYNNDPMTSVMAVVGPNTAMGKDQSLSVSDIGADVIVLIEVHQSRIHWAEPGDCSVTEEQMDYDVTSGPRDGFFVGFADGSVWYLRKDVPVADLAKFCDVKRAKTSDRESVLGKYCKRRRGPLTKP